MIEIRMELFELESLLDLGNSLPALPSGHPFTYWQGDSYWSSTTSTLTPVNAWIVNIAYGLVDLHTKHRNLYVWPVRGGH
jgi:hypothetical protein